MFSGTTKRYHTIEVSSTVRQNTVTVFFFHSRHIPRQLVVRGLYEFASSWKPFSIVCTCGLSHCFLTRIRIINEAQVCFRSWLPNSAHFLFCKKCYHKFVRFAGSLSTLTTSEHVILNSFGIQVREAPHSSKLKVIIMHDAIFYWMYPYLLLLNNENINCFTYIYAQLLNSYNVPFSFSGVTDQAPVLKTQSYQ